MTGSGGLPKFITLEGLEGGGKSTCIAYVCELLDEAGVPYVLTREPGGTAIAEQLRDLLLDEQAEPVVPMSELLLMFAGRAQHIEHVIKPALARNQWVICDRFTDATFAYQGAGREIGRENVEILEEMVQGKLRPDATIILDVSFEVGMARVEGRGKKDRFEQESESFFNRVREAYLYRAGLNPERYTVIDAGKSLDLVKASLKKSIRELI